MEDVFHLLNVFKIYAVGSAGLDLQLLESKFSSFLAGRYFSGRMVDVRQRPAAELGLGLGLSLAIL